MTPQETALVTSLLDRLKKTGGQPKDVEAETLIGRTIAEQSDAAYYLTQTVLIQDLSLEGARHRITELEQTLATAKAAASPPRSFLAGMLGAGQPPNPVPPSTVPPGTVAPSSTGYDAQPGSPAPAGPAGGGFLRGAVMTAAGVAGGALLFEGIQSIVGQHGAAGAIDNQTPVAGLGETITGQDFGGGEPS